MEPTRYHPQDIYFNDLTGWYVTEVFTETS